jgi:membrane-anchored protein YejM (alkaline phosphatase superfamily)
MPRSTESEPVLVNPVPSVPTVQNGRQNRAGYSVIAADTGARASMRSFLLQSAWLVFFFGVRLLFAAFILLTSVYCLLQYIPFAYLGFLRDPAMNWIFLFVQVHARIDSMLLAAVAVSLVPAMRGQKTRASALGFVLLNAIFCAYQLGGHGLAAVTPNIFSYIWSIGALFPLVWLVAIDLQDTDRNVLWNDAGDWQPLDLGTGLLAAGAVTIAFALAGLLRQFARAPQAASSDSLAAFGVSLLFHVAIFSTFAIGAVVLAQICRRLPWPRPAYVISSLLVIWLLCAQVLRTIVLPTISFEGMQATVFSMVFSGCLLFLVAGEAAKARSLAARIGVRSAATPNPVWRRASVLLILCAGAYAIPVLFGARDWDFVLQKTSVLLLWTFALAAFCWADIRWRIKKPAAIIAVVLVVLACDAAALRLASATTQNRWSDSLESFAGSDISFKTAYALVARSVETNNYNAFYDFLKSRTNIREPERPVDLSLVSNLHPSAGAKPNIFIFVIDSMRRDFISPYNPAISTTPEFEKFAKDSVVFENAFTRYAGTALSEPAIWVGAMQLHKQYIEPFYSMNNLQKLVDADGYHSYVSLDPILQRVVAKSASLTELDSNLKVMSDYDYAVVTGSAAASPDLTSTKSRKSWSTLDLVTTLNELETKLDARSDKHSPVFVYTQPQNIHTLTLEQSASGKSRREISADEVQRMDSAFGRFIQFLKSRDMYDNSIIVITSDHGDSYGEFGRFGHADFLFPEVIRIPLIIHLPSALQKQAAYDPRAVVFSLDITPSLYYLLGHRPTTNRELFGRPLFTAALQEQAPYHRDLYLLASSYAPVYGLLDANGQSLFIVDAVNQKNYFYDLSTDPEGVHNRVTPRVRDENEAWIREQLGMIDRLYGTGSN